MEPWLIWILVLAIGAIGAYIASRIAASKGHSPVVFGILGFVLPLVGVIIAAVLPKKQ